MVMEIDDKEALSFFGLADYDRFAPKALGEQGTPTKQIRLPIDNEIKRLLARKSAPRINFQDSRHYVPVIKAGREGPYYYARTFLFITAIDCATSPHKQTRAMIHRFDTFIHELRSARVALRQLVCGIMDDDPESNPNTIANDLFRGYGSLPDYGPDRLSKAFKAARQRLNRDVDALFAAYDALERLEQRSSRQIQRVSYRAWGVGCHSR
jgi:hypothetical protein